jgi:hypothetical protein
VGDPLIPILDSIDKVFTPFLEPILPSSFTLNFGTNNFPNWFNDYLFTLLLFGLVFFILQLWKKITSELCPAINLNIFLNSLVVAIKIYLIVLFWDSNGSHFIYFQF